MKPRSRHGLRNALVALALVFVGATMFLRTRVAADEACALARRQLPGLLGVDVAIERCELRPFTQTVVLHGFALSRAGEPLFSTDSAEVSLGALHPFFGELHLDALKLRSPSLALDLSQPRPPDAAPPTCPVEALNRVIISRLDIENAALAVKLPEGRSFELHGLDLEWRLRRGVAEFRLGAQRGELVPGGSIAAMAVSKLSLEGALDADEERLELTRAEVGVDDLSASISGRVEQLCDPRLALDGQLFIPVKALARLVPGSQTASGHLWARVSASGKPIDPTLNLEVVAHQAAWERYRPGDFEAKAVYARRTLQLQELTLPAGPGVARVSGEIGLTGELPARLRLIADDAEFARVLEKTGLPGAWVDFFASGTAEVKGQLRPLVLEGETELRVSKFELATRPFDAPAKQGRDLLRFANGRVAGPVRILSDRTEFPSLAIESGKSRASAAAVIHYAAARGLSVAMRTEAFDLSDFGELAQFHTDGRGELTVEVQGPYADVEIAGALNLRDFEFWDFSLGVVQAKIDYRDKALRFPAISGQKGKSQYFGSAELQFGDPLHTRGEFTFPRGQTSDLIDLLARVSTVFEVLQGDVGGEAAATVKLSGPAETFAGGAEVALYDTTYLDRRLGDGRLDVEFLDGEAMTQSLRLTGPLGETRLEGTFHFDGPLDYQFSGERLSLAELIGPERARSLDAGGSLTLAGRIEGDSTTPVVSGYVRSPRITFAGRDLGALHLDARMLGRELEVFGKPFGDASGTLKLTARAPYPYETNLTLSLPEIRPLLPEGAISQGLSGSLSGRLYAKGTLRNFSDALEARGTIEQLRLSRGDFAGQNDGPVVLEYAGGRLEFDRLAFRGPNTELLLSGWAGPANLDVKLHGTVDMRLLESFVPVLERTGGRVEVTAAAAGRLGDPQLSGSAELQNVQLQLRDQPASLRALSGRLEFSEARVLVPELRGVLNDGRVAIRGDLELAKFKPRHLELGLQLDEVTFRFVEDLSVKTSGELLLVGRPDALKLGGSLDVNRFTWERPLVLEAAIAEIGKRRTFSFTSDEKPREWLGFDVAVHLGDVRIDNNLAKAKLLGDVRLTGTNVRPGLLGTITAAGGSQVFFRSNQFAVDQALIEFKERNAFEPIFDLHAQAQVREYLVKLHAFGRPQDPQVILTAEPGLAENDIISLLTVGVTSRDELAENTSAAGTGALLAADAFLAASGLDKQVQRFIPSQVFRDLSFHLSTRYNDASGLVEPAAQLESTFLTEQLKLEINQPVSFRGTRANLEYFFNDRISGQLQWDTEQNQSSYTNLGADLKMRWEIE